MSDSTGASSAPVRSSPDASRTLTGIFSSVYVWLALLMIGISIVGFWENYFGPLVRGTLNAHWAVDVHAAVYTVWLFLFLGQALLISRNRIRRHQTIGRYVGIGWGTGMLIIGLFITLAVIVPSVGRDHEVGNYAISLLGSLEDLVTFGGFFVAGVLYRRRPEIHKRLMVLATVALMGAPVGRLIGDVGGGFIGKFSFLAGVRLSPAILAMIYDRWYRGRVHPVYWIGMGILLLNVSRLLWARTGLWQSTARSLMETVAPLMRALLAG